jgi:hypothetical protein
MEQTAEQIAAAKNVDQLDAEVAEKVPEADRTPAQKRIIQLVSQRKAVEAERDALKAQYNETQSKLAAREKAEKDASDAAALAKAKQEGDYTALVAKLQAEREAEKAEYEEQAEREQTVIMERAGKMVLQALAIQGGMTNPDHIKLFDCEIELDPNTLEVTAEGMKALKEDFEKFKKANPNLFGPTRQTVTSPDGKPAKMISPEDKFTATQGKGMSPIELIAAGLAKQASGR